MNVVSLRDWIPSRMRVAAKKKLPAKSRKNKPMTDKQKADAKMLERFWGEVERARETEGRPHSKKAMALKWGVNPSNVSQYINGHIPLNVEAQLWFADYLDVAPIDIWPDFQFKHLVPGKLPPDAIEVATTYAQLAKDTDKESARNLLNSLPKRPHK